MKRQMRGRIGVMVVAVVVNTLLVALRFYAYRATRSAAILADALESVVNIAASAFALFAVWFSRRRDSHHPFGHPWIESASAALEGFLISAAAAAILYETCLGRTIADGVAGVFPYTGVAAATLALGWWLTRAGKRMGSLAIGADGAHAFVDAVTAFGVTGALILVRVTGRPVIDTMVASILGAFIAYEGWGLIRRAVPRLVSEGE